MKTNRILSLALAALCAAASGSAFAQSSYSVVTLPSTAVIDSVASNGALLYEIDGAPNSNGFSTISYFTTGANGASPVADGSEVVWNTPYGGVSPQSGNNPVGAETYTGLSYGFQINSVGTVLGLTNGYLGVYSTVVKGGTATGYDGFTDTSLPSIPTALSNTGALASVTDDHGSPIATLTFWAPGAAPTAYSSIALAGSAVGYNPATGVTQVAISNTTNRVAGTIYTPATGLEQAFYSTPNAHSVSYIPTSAANEGSSADTINDAGQVGGQLRYLTGGVLSETAFITSSAGAIVPIGVGAPGDDTETLFLNDSGQAIIEDQTSGAYYFYSGGTVYSVDSLFGLTGNDPVVGLTSSGGIVLADPGIYTPDFATLTGGTENSSTQQFKSYESYATPGGASVPAPTSAGLLGLGLLGLIAGVRARKQAVPS